MNRITHFEIHADKPERAAKFYTSVFGWEIKKWSGLSWDYWIVMTAPQDSKEPGINGGLLKRPDCDPLNDNQAVNAFVCTVVVDDIDKTIKKVEKEGGKVAMSKFAIPGLAWQAYCKDTEGNTFGIHQSDISAK